MSGTRPAAQHPFWAAAQKQEAEQADRVGTEAEQADRVGTEAEQADQGLLLPLRHQLGQVIRFSAPEAPPSTQHSSPSTQHSSQQVLLSALGAGFLFVWYAHTDLLPHPTAYLALLVCAAQVQVRGARAWWVAVAVAVVVAVAGRRTVRGSRGLNASSCRTINNLPSSSRLSSSKRWSRAKF
jgi:hypothetical protein